MKPIHIAAALAALALLTGCVTRTVTETVFVQPECQVPPVPALPPVHWAELHGSDDALNRLEEYEALLVDSLLEHRAILNEVCHP